MKQLKGALDNAIRELGARDETTVNRLLDIVEKMAEDLRPSVRRSVAPLGQSCKSMTLKYQDHNDTYDESDKAAATASKDNEITGSAEYSILITELDLERGTGKVRIENGPEDQRIHAVITDPLLQTSNNPYTTALSAGEYFPVIAKAQMSDGAIARLFISDVS